MGVRGEHDRRELPLAARHTARSDGDDGYSSSVPIPDELPGAVHAQILPMTVTVQLHGAG